MTRAKTTSSQSQKLMQLRHKHSDKSGKGRRLSKVQEVAPKKASHKRFFSGKLTQSQYSQSLRELYTFFFAEMSLLVLWVAYRAVTHFPIWFDEGIAKALVFGLPVFWLAARSRYIANNIGLDVSKILPGMYLGVAVGGLYGFAAILAETTSGTQIAPGNLFLTDQFWWMAFLAFLTAWWESIFFFGLPIQYIRSKASWMSDWMIFVFVLVLFLAFHAPLRLIVSGGGPGFVTQMGILSLFVIGQFILYTRTRNMYALVLSHFFWGLVIEIYSR